MESSKRKSLEANITPDRRSPSNIKLSRIRSPSTRVCRSRKSLGFHEEENLSFANALNVDDLNVVYESATSQTSSANLKVVIAYPNGDVVVKSNLDPDSKNLIKNVALSQWKTAMNVAFKHKHLYSEFVVKLESEVDKEMTEYSKSDTILKISDPDQLAAFSNKILCREIETNCPLYSSVIKSACNAKAKPESTNNAMALATSSLARCRNPKMSALAYRISTILFHSGISYCDATRLHHLGISMSPQMAVDLHNKMGENSDYKVLLWKRKIEVSKTALLLLEEVKERQARREDDDMIVEITIDVERNTLSNYHYFSSKVFDKVHSHLGGIKTRMGESATTEDVLLEAINELRGEKLPYFK